MRICAHWERRPSVVSETKHREMWRTCARLTQNELLCQRVPNDGGREADAAAALSARVDAPRRDVADVLQQLACGTGRIVPGVCVGGRNESVKRC